MSRSYQSPDRISRQFTDSELAMDDRVSNFLQQPIVSGAQGNSMGETYHWLREDLNARAGMSEALQDSQRMAFEQSGRHQLHKQAVELEDEEREATEGFNKLNGLVKGGMDFKNAAAKVIGENGKLGVNDKFTGQVDAFGKVYESDEEGELRRLKDHVVKLGLTSQAFDLEAADNYIKKNPEAATKALDLYTKRKATEEIGVTNAAQAANIAQLKGLAELRQLESEKNSWNSALSGTPAEQQAKRGSLLHSFAKAGLEGVQNPDLLIKGFANTPSVIDALANRSFIESKFPTPEAKQEFSQAINDATNAALPEGDPVKTKAQNLLLRLGGENQERLAEVSKFEKRLKDADETTKAWGVPYKDFSSTLDDIQSSDNKIYKNKQVRTAHMVDAARGFVGQAKASMPISAGLNGAFDEFDKQLEGLKAGEDSALTAKTLREMVSGFVSGAKDMQARGVVGKPPAQAGKTSEIKEGQRAQNPKDGKTYIYRNGQWTPQ